MLRGALRPPPSRSPGPEPCGRWHPRLRARGARRPLACPREGPRRRRAGALGEAGVVPVGRRGLFLDQYLTNLDHQGATDYADLIRRATIEAEAHREELRAVPPRLRRRVPGHRPRSGGPAQGAGRRRSRPDGRGRPVPVDLRLRRREVRGILDFPAAFPRTDGEPAPVVALRTTRRFGPRLLVATQRVARPLALPGSITPVARGVPRPGAADRLDEGSSSAPVETERAEAEHLADLLRRPPRGRRPLGPDGCPGALRALEDPAPPPGPGGGRRAGRVSRDDCRWSRTRRCCRSSTRCGP